MTAFRFELRVVVCQRCGAPIEADPSGGSIACRYCNATHQVAPRLETQIEPGAEVIDEHHRLAILRQQDGRPLVPPASLQPLLENGQLLAWKEQEALAVYQSTCDELRRGDSFEAAERLMVLTIMLSNHYAGMKEPLRHRALYETALDVFRLPRHKQVTRGFLARNAACAADIEGAERWLAPCNPRSRDLQADSAWRVSRATIDTAKGIWPAVLAVLGERHGVIPIADSNDPMAVVLRANALERTGQVDAAIAELQAFLRTPASPAVATILHAFAVDHGWHLCPSSMPRARQNVATESARSAQAVRGAIAAMTIGPFVLASIITVVIVVVVAAVMLVAFGVAWFGVGR